MKKKIFIGLLSLSLIGGSATADAARYFMQGDAQGSSTPYGDNLKVGKYAQTDDAKIYYEVYGKGEPILILHGGGVGSPYEMGKIIDVLKKNYKVIVMSTRGHGRSEIGHSPMTYKQKADDAVAVLNAVGEKSAQIIGFSDGAYTAYEIAALYPERVERIAAIGAGTLQKNFFGDSMSLADLEKIDAEFIAEQKKIRPEPERWQEFCDKYMNFWHNMSVGAETFDKIKSVLQAHQLIKNSRLCVVPKAWHSAFIDNYDVTTTAIFQFVNSPLKNLTASKKVDYNSKN